MVDYILKTLVLGPLETNCYILHDKNTKSCVIIDPADEAEEILSYTGSKSLNIEALIITHGHADHIRAVNAIKGLFDARLMIHSKDADYLKNPGLNGSVLLGEPFTTPNPDKLLENNSKISVGCMELQVIHTPGHTPGCICLKLDDLLFTGDTLFCGSVGRWDLPGGDEQALMNSLKIFTKFHLDTKILPGHARACTIKGEMIHNPYLTSL